jgi:molybdopterin/thiamine biosynthesis adenylyltransferase
MPSRTDPFDHPVVEHITCTPFRRPKADQSPTSRLELIAGHDQHALADATILLVGLGAQGHIAHGLLRSGATRLIGCDPDYFATSNFSRQVGYSADRGKPKAHRVFRNLQREAVNGAELTSIALPFPQALMYIPGPPSVVSCLVDDNACRLAVSDYACRLAVSDYARRQGIPAIIAGLSHDGVRSYAFLQMPGEEAPCLACAFPDLQLVRAACVAASIKGVFQVAADVLHFIDVALMGWPADAEPHNLRLADLHGRIEENRTVEREPGCWMCGKL